MHGFTIYFPIAIYVVVEIKATFIMQHWLCDLQFSKHQIYMTYSNQNWVKFYNGDMEYPIF